MTSEDQASQGTSGPVDVHQETPSDLSGATLALKRTVQAIFVLFVLPRLLLYRIASTFLGQERAFHAASESISRIPGNRGVYARQAFYRHALASCGRDVYFGWSSVFSTPRAVIGDRVYVGRRCNIGFAAIGAQTLLSDGVQILSGARQHGSGQSAEAHQDQPLQFKKVVIGDNVWLGTNAIVMADVGDGSIVGAGAVVTGAIPQGITAVGIPARPVNASGP